MCTVLVITAAVLDDLEAVVGYIRLEGSGGCPGEGAGVGGALGDAGDGKDVRGGAAEEDEGDGARRSRRPGYGEGGADGDNLIQRGGDGVAHVGAAGFLGAALGGGEGEEGGKGKEG